MMFKSYFASSSPAAYEVRTPHTKSYSAGPSAYHPQKYVPQQYATPLREPSRGAHGRRVTVDTADFDHTAPLPAYMTQPAYSYPTPVQIRQPKSNSFSNETDRLRAKATRYSDARTPSKSSKAHKISVKLDDIDPQYFDDYSPQGTPPPPYNDYSDTSYRQHDDYRTYSAAPPSYQKPRARASSSAQKPFKPDSSKKSRAVPQALPVATKADIRRWGLPAQCECYSLKNWDPTEEPITLLGSVFDANSLGKWIYDWTVFHHGAGAPMSDEAGQLWLCLIELGSKRKRAEECLPRIRSRKRRNLVEDYLVESDDIWQRLTQLLVKCESYMWAKAERENRGSGKTQFGSNSGCEFVDSIFGRDRELLTSQELINDIRVWTHGFDDRCEEILRRPRE